MNKYTKINTVFKRDMTNGGKTLLIGEYSTPEFEYLKDNTWEWTEKVDGTNIRIKIEDGKLDYLGKSDNAQIPSKLVSRLREMFDPQLERMMEVFPDGACLYGEGYGAKIQKMGACYGSSQEFVLFDVKIAQWWLGRSNVGDVAKKLGIHAVPIIGEGTIAEMIEAVVGGIVSTWGDFQAEGIVARPKVELFNRNNERIIAKLKTRDFHK